jgi:hypothetical protein
MPQKECLFQRERDRLSAARSKTPLSLIIKIFVVGIKCGDDVMWCCMVMLDSAYYLSTVDEIKSSPV